MNGTMRGLKNLQKMENISVQNIAPTYIEAKNSVSEEVAKVLMELVDERGGRSVWNNSSDCFEFQIANPFSKRKTPNDEKVISVLPDLFGLGESCLRHINWNFKNTVCNMATGHHGFWILRYDQGAGFETHCDWDSGPNAYGLEALRPPIIATVAILLNEDFRGGEMVLFDSTGEPSIVKQNVGSAVIWDGFTHHKVSPVTEGSRYALVIHYTGTIK